MTLVVDTLDVRHGGVHAVRGLSLEVAPGEMVGLIGPNGAGKSSTLHAIMGLAPATGSVRLGDRELLGLRPEDVARSGVALSTPPIATSTQSLLHIVPALPR